MDRSKICFKCTLKLNQKLNTLLHRHMRRCDVSRLHNSGNTALNREEYCSNAELLAALNFFYRGLNIIFQSQTAQPASLGLSAAAVTRAIGEASCWCIGTIYLA